jgi:hypothetical protein
MPPLTGLFHFVGCVLQICRAYGANWNCACLRSGVSLVAPNPATREKAEQSAAFFSFIFQMAACRVSAPKARKPVAHGFTVGLAVEKSSPGRGDRKQAVKRFFRPVPGLGRFAVENPRLHRGLLSVAAPQPQMDFENTP